MITVQNLTKTYGRNTILRDISIQFREGLIYGLVGANGCGKTTLMRCICGFSQPTSGYVVVNGCLVGNKAVLRRNPQLRESANPPYQTLADFAPSTGAIIESPGFLNHETGLRNLLLLADMSGRAGRADARRAMTMLGLDPDEKKARWKVFAGHAPAAGFCAGVHGEPGCIAAG